MKKRILLAAVVVLFNSATANAFIVWDPLVYYTVSAIREINTGILSTNENILQTDLFILETNKEILNINKQILSSQTGGREGDTVVIKSKGLLDTVLAPKLLDILEKGKSVEDIVKKTKRVKQVLDHSLEGTEKILKIAGKTNPTVAKVNEYFSDSRDAVNSFMAIGDVVAEGLIEREKELKAAIGNIGKAKDIKGSMDQNTAQQAENNRSLVELISVVNNLLGSQNLDRRENLQRLMQVGKFLGSSSESGSAASDPFAYLAGAGNPPTQEDIDAFFNEPT